MSVSFMPMMDQQTSGLLKTVCHAQNLICKFWGNTQDIMQAYKDGIGWEAEKEYKSHRRVLGNHVG